MNGQAINWTIDDQKLRKMIIRESFQYLDAVLPVEEFSLKNKTASHTSYSIMEIAILHLEIWSRNIALLF